MADHKMIVDLFCKFRTDVTYTVCEWNIWTGRLDVVNMENSVKFFAILVLFNDVLKRIIDLGNQFDALCARKVLADSRSLLKRLVIDIKLAKLLYNFLPRLYLFAKHIERVIFNLTI